MVLVNSIYIHTKTMTDFTQAEGLLAFLYWTQTNSDALEEATAYASSLSFSFSLLPP